jgi:DNA-binding response OmpR family regulator
MRIAILDDDDSQVQLISYLLEKAGFACHGFADGHGLLKDLKRESFDLLVLDWSVPDMNGTEIMTWVRANLPQRVPVLFVTGRTSENDIVAGLAAGADDYMIKPLRGPELVARVQALLRRAYPETVRDQISFGVYRFETTRNEVHLETESGIKTALLTQKEFDLALMLFRNAGRPLSRSHIREVVWGRDIEIPSRTMDTHISRIRSKLELRPEHGYRLVPVYSYGYRLDQVPDQALSSSATAPSLS